MGMSAWPWSQVGRGAEHPDMHTRTAHFQGMDAEHPPVPLMLQPGAERNQTAGQEWLSPILTALTPHSKFIYMF